MLVEHRQTVDTQLRPQVALGKKIRGGEIKTPYSGKVLEEENFCEFQAIHKSFLCENVIFHKFTKVYFLESFPLYGNHRGGRTSSKEHVKNYIPFLGMRKVHGDLQRLNK